ncbi:MAG: MFS transporter [Acidimicrobiia bacterium]|nr:MFS transporter [Acidimicrobiia bacterium]
MKPVDPAPPLTGQFVFAGLLMWVMVGATAITTIIPVLATFLIDDFGVTKVEIGAIGLVVNVLAAVASPFAGRIADRIGGENAALIVLVGAAVAAVLVAGAPVFPAVFVGGSVAAITAAGANPGTNKLIAEHIERGRRGLITGLKQTGPQVGALFAGLLAPWGATAFGWRPTLIIMAVALVLPVPFLMRMTTPASAVQSDNGAPMAPLPSGIWWVAAYGGLLGLGGSAVFLLPLFVEERLGQTPRVAGLATALLGGIAIFGRLQWARTVERRTSQANTLAMLSLVAIVATILMLISTTAGIGWMWAGTVAFGLSAASWTAVGSMAVMAIVGSSEAGRASGVVWFGFLTGYGLGPPLYGFTVDKTGSYTVMWWLALGMFLLATGVALGWAHTQRISSGRRLLS